MAADTGGRKPDIYEQAKAIYNAQLRHLEAEHKGKFLVLDVSTWDYEVDNDRAQATLRMLERHPEEDWAFFSFRVGSPPAYWQRPVRVADASPDSIGHRARAIYDAELRHLEAEHKGKFLVLDVPTGDYEIDAKHVQAVLRMLERHPVDEERAFFSFRIGYRATYQRDG